MTDRISSRQFHESEGVDDWRVIGDGACAYFRSGSFAASARLAAGGRMVRDAFAPSWWTLADATGNEVDIATTRR